MRARWAAPVTTILIAALPLCAQELKPKSPKEAQALKEVQDAKDDPNLQMQKIDFVLENFTDTAYKTILLNMATDDAQRAANYEKTVIYGERTVEADPGNIAARITLAETIAAHTRENDLDKEQSLKKVDDYANKALDLIKTATAPAPGVPPEQWPDVKKDYTAEAHEALGQAAELRKKYDEAITDYKTAIEEAARPNPSVSARLAKAYNENKQYDDAIATADKVLALPDAPAVVKQFAQQQKDAATKMKSAK